MVRPASVVSSMGAGGATDNEDDDDDGAAAAGSGTWMETSCMGFRDSMVRRRARLDEEGLEDGGKDHWRATNGKEISERLESSRYSSRGVSMCTDWKNPGKTSEIGGGKDSGGGTVSTCSRTWLRGRPPAKPEGAKVERGTLRCMRRSVSFTYRPRPQSQVPT